MIRTTKFNLFWESFINPKQTLYQNYCDMFYLFITLLLLISELFFFRVAKIFNIIDKPNERSLHTEITIRGGGIIFPISAFIYFFYSEMQYPYFFIGLFLIALVSFLDDIYTIPNRYRIVVHFLSLFLLLYQIDTYFQIGVGLLLLIIILVGIINAYNFMDGVNGITGGYSLITLLTLFYVNNYLTNFVTNEFIIIISLGVLVFNFFNFREKAICFAGDVGSVSIAFIIIFLIVKLISLSNQYIYILFLSLYGIDTIFTLFIRIWRKENIFKAHNKHFFQLLVHKWALSHLQVSLIYACVQLIVNSVIIFVIKSKQDKIVVSITILAVLSCIYIYYRMKIIKLRITIK